MFEHVIKAGVFKHVYNKCEEKFGAFVEGVNKFVLQGRAYPKEILG